VSKPAKDLLLPPLFDEQQQQHLLLFSILQALCPSLEMTYSFAACCNMYTIQTAIDD
jgi:hypothetical protein